MHESQKVPLMHKNKFVMVYKPQVFGLLCYELFQPPLLIRSSQLTFLEVIEGDSLTFITVRQKKKHRPAL